MSNHLIAETLWSHRSVCTVYNQFTAFYCRWTKLNVFRLKANQKIFKKIRPYQFNNLVLGIALSDFFENVKKKYKSTSGQKLDRKVQYFEFI